MKVERQFPRTLPSILLTLAPHSSGRRRDLIWLIIISVAYSMGTPIISRAEWGDIFPCERYQRSTDWNILTLRMLVSDSMGIPGLLIAFSIPIFMPHILNLNSVKPLRWVVTEYTPDPTRLSSIQLTGRHLHAQPAMVRFKDETVACAFFEDGKLIYLEQLHPSRKTIEVSDKKLLKELIPEEVERVPIPHIKRHEENIEKLQHFAKKCKEPLSHFVGKSE